MARAAAGLADDLAACVLLATRAPGAVGPGDEHQHVASSGDPTQPCDAARARGRVRRSRSRRAQACGWIGEGRSDRPAADRRRMQALLTAGRKDMTEGTGVWAGRRVLISAGPTRTYIEPGSLLSNASTGAMGFALAAAARALGAEVTLVAGPVELATPAGVRRRQRRDRRADARRARAGALAERPSICWRWSPRSRTWRSTARARSSTRRPVADDGRSAVAHGRGYPPASLTARHSANAGRPFFLGFAAQTVADETGGRGRTAPPRCGQARQQGRRCDLRQSRRGPRARLRQPDQRRLPAGWRPHGGCRRDREALGPGGAEGAEFAGWMLTQLTTCLGKAST